MPRLWAHMVEEIQCPQGTSSRHALDSFTGSTTGWMHLNAGLFSRSSSQELFTINFFPLIKPFPGLIMTANAHPASWRPGLMTITSFSSSGSPHLLTSILSNMSGKGWFITCVTATAFLAIRRSYGSPCRRNGIH